MKLGIELMHNFILKVYQHLNFRQQVYLYIYIYLNLIYLSAEWAVINL